ncbi:MAG: serine/threonine protein kinase [Phycisphaerales bacterium]|nr:MAG: serine/threonine protein kinase [Phycisphaerales bacterium]
MLTPDQARVLARDLLEESAEEPTVPMPECIGSYRVRRVIGVGGMGTAYEAEQEHPRRTVALKILNRGIASKSALRRFEHEAEMLAHLQHAGIAQVYEAGTHDDGGGGVPFFAMEYVPGAKNIVEYAEANELTTRQRLELFAKVCDAVHHGHQKGIIHRDLKPANILVGELPSPPSGGGRGAGGEGQPKIIDFGVARATDSDIAVTTMQTDVGRLIGTLQYMSPEQCEGDPHPQNLDTRSDVYSLGVVLYELLCGRLPYEVSSSSIAHAARTIQDEEPTRPSTIIRKLRGNIEVITLKTLEKDREKRYQSAAELAADIRRHLTGQPIEARPPTPWTRGMRWVVKHPIVTTAATCALVAFIAIGLTVGSVWYLGLRPHHVELTDDGREARLVSVAGHILHTWRCDTGQGISFADLVNRPEELGGGKIVLVGYRDCPGDPHTGMLCAFEPRGDLDTPLWTRQIRTDAMPSELIGRNFEGEQFYVSFCWLADVLSGRPGDEIIVAHKHAPYSACAICIYDLEGELLFQCWQDGGVSSCYWMSGPRLLVFAGLDAQTWNLRGRPDVGGYPRVVFAIQPEVGYVSKRWLSSSSNGTDSYLAWIRCVMPPVSSTLFANHAIIAPNQGEDPTRLARLGLYIGNLGQGSISLLLDESGEEIDGERIISDPYNRNPARPDDDSVFELGSIPPLVPPAMSSTEES